MNQRTPLRTFLNILMIFVSVVFLIFGIAVTAYAYELQQHNAQAEKNLAYPSEWMVMDSYDTAESTISDFFSTPESYDILSSTYQLLRENSVINYCEAGMQDITYLGYFMGSGDLVDGEEDSVNQKVNGMYITPLKSIQVDERFIKLKHIDSMLGSGEFFDHQDFHLTCRDTVPVIVGNRYREFVNVGDMFWGYYLGEKKIRYEVTGFLSPNSSICIGSDTVNLDHVIVTPTISVNDLDSDYFNKILLSVKCGGVIYYKNKADYCRILNEVSNISRRTGYKFELPVTELKNENILRLGLFESAFILFLSFILLLVVTSIAGKNPFMPSKILSSFPKSTIAVNFIIFCGLYFAAYYSLIHVFRNHLAIIQSAQYRVIPFILLSAIAITVKHLRRIK